MWKNKPSWWCFLLLACLPACLPTCLLADVCFFARDAWRAHACDCVVNCAVAVACSCLRRALWLSSYACSVGASSATPARFACNDPAEVCPDGLTKVAVGKGNYSIMGNTGVYITQARCPLGFYCVDGEKSSCPAVRQPTQPPPHARAHPPALLVTYQPPFPCPFLAHAADCGLTMCVCVCVWRCVAAGYLRQHNRLGQRHVFGRLSCRVHVPCRQLVPHAAQLLHRRLPVLRTHHTRTRWRCQRCHQRRWHRVPCHPCGLHRRLHVRWQPRHERGQRGAVRPRPLLRARHRGPLSRWSVQLVPGRLALPPPVPAWLLLPAGLGEWDAAQVRRSRGRGRDGRRRRPRRHGVVRGNGGARGWLVGAGV